MRDFHIGDRVTFSDRPYFVRGFSPMGVPERTIHLEDAETGARIEIAFNESAVNAMGACVRSVGPRDAIGLP
jgi:hypothetical protein